MASPIRARPSAHLGLEIWAVGTVEQLHALRSALASVGYLAEVGNTAVLFGADAGRSRQYLRAKTRDA